MKTAPLNGLRLLNTRPHGQGRRLCEEVIAHGGSVVHCPLLKIVTNTDAWVSTLPSLASVDIAIFISTNAVECALSTLAKQHISWPKSIHVIAIGKATAAALQSHHILAHEVPQTPDSEHLLLLPSLQQPKKIVALFKGDGGRALIEQILMQKTSLFVASVYHRALPKISPQFTKQLWQENAVDIILITSEQSLKNIFILFDEAAHAWLKSKPFLVISNRLAKATSSMGISEVRISHPEELLDSLLKFKESQNNGR